jgi:hypothetical protein
MVYDATIVFGIMFIIRVLFALYRRSEKLLLRWLAAYAQCVS